MNTCSAFRFLLSVLLTIVTAHSVYGQFLHEGDTIAIVSPSSATDTATINGGMRTLQSWGYRCVVGRHALNQRHGFAGSASERADDLLWALRSPSVKAIMCSRGGDGAVQLLCRIPLDTLRRYPKLIIGFSDITALLCAAACAGHVGIHGSMCHALTTYEGTDTVSQTLRRMLEGQLPAYQVAPHPLNQQGVASGVLVGGNMSVLHGLAGSDFDPLTMPDIILFIEDTGESMTKVDRMLHNIMVRGLMAHVRGIVVGQFGKYKFPENGFADMYDMLSDYLRHYPIPVCYDFPVGHRHLRNFPLLTGARVTLSVTADGAMLTYQ